MIKRLAKGMASYLIKEHLEYAINRSLLNSFVLSTNGMTNDLVSESGRSIVSLTTYGGRIYDVRLVIESLGLQTKKPKKIILWLDEGEFSTKDLPIALLQQIDRGLEIRFCENLRSYKKIIPTLRCFRDAQIITVDDDYIYPADLIERLEASLIERPKCIVSSFIHRMKFTKDGLPQNYARWDKYIICDEPSMDVFPVGAGGVLYPRGCFDNHVLDSALFMEIAPTADDVWLKYCAAKAGFKSTQIKGAHTFASSYIELPSSQVNALYHENVLLRANDKQVAAVHELFFKNQKFEWRQN